MSKNRKPWEGKKNIESWRERKYEGPFSMGIYLWYWVMDHYFYGIFGLFAWANLYANVNRERKKGITEIFVILRYVDQQFHFFTLKNHQSHGIDLKTKGKLKREFNLCDILKRKWANTKWVDQVRMYLSYFNHRSPRQ